MSESLTALKDRLILTPHSMREGEFRVQALRQLAELGERSGKPVIDDEPVRTAIRQFAGRAGHVCRNLGAAPPAARAILSTQAG